MEIPKQEPTWAELLGSNQWKGLLEPLDLNLRELIIRCGDFCQATYDSFNSDQHSKYCGSSRYGKTSLFEKVALISAENYFIDTFLYATARIKVPKAFLCFSISDEAWDRESNWIGYICVTTDEVSKALGRREIYVAWRGTIRTLEWINVFDAQPASIEPLLNAIDANPTPIKPLLKPISHIEKHWYDIFLGKKNEDESSSEDEGEVF
ncbi:hypothetical protein BVC80_1261g14 [Macleaya cordata]|uniref:Phospholipase A1 n=1 Tax=Macleaya cordata TaxID=56857 RepID=A0A200PV61_MACCD|nr:hypothetical protein BVC80_1261g14 [Macleaya cordata]